VNLTSALISTRSHGCVGKNSEGLPNIAMVVGLRAAANFARLSSCTLPMAVCHSVAGKREFWEKTAFSHIDHPGGIPARQGSKPVQSDVSFTTTKPSAVETTQCPSSEIPMTTRPCSSSRVVLAASRGLDRRPRGEKHHSPAHTLDHVDDLHDILPVHRRIPLDVHRPLRRTAHHLGSQQRR